MRATRAQKKHPSVAWLTYERAAVAYFSNSNEFGCGEASWAATKEKFMNRTFANCTIALICIAPAVIVGAALLFGTLIGQSPSGADPVAQANPIEQTTTVGRAD